MNGSESRKKKFIEKAERRATFMPARNARIPLGDIQA